MKRTPLSILFLFVAQVAFPQFNSIEFQKELPLVTVIQQPASPSKLVGLDLRLLSQLIQSTKKEREVLLASPPLEDFFMTSKYGYRSDPFSREQTFHRGIDLKTNRSTIYSILHGKVVSVGNDPLLGNFIKVQHGKYVSIYGHISQVLVSPEEYVLPGSVLGISGSTGRAAGDHLHLSIKNGKDYINPVLFIQMISKVSTKEELITYLSKQ
ncbi:M23 family metallopeptidase [Algoriphagus sp. C2-6-M1]|uniref:M23 family metallopeptidase n=1 Tax=Algoriphagus persicinus TaxID=3108754 RepID=UPI002B37CB87|nr:M23 family metallopeptidase [Algoriphagus sp. C2-6-M1]MEB2780777.1 M23 family metallopeptidase [Algoriphagus sp. C2-6-M1]